MTQEQDKGAITEAREVIVTQDNIIRYLLSITDQELIKGAVAMGEVTDIYDHTFKSERVLNRLDDEVINAVPSKVVVLGGRRQGMSERFQEEVIARATILNDGLRGK